MTSRAQGPLPALPPAVHSSVIERVRRVLSVLDHDEVRPSEEADLLQQLEDLLAENSAEQLWLVGSVLGGRMLSADELPPLRRQVRLVGPWKGLDSIFHAVAKRYGRDGSLPPVAVIDGQTTAEAGHTAGADFTSGIQRVAREVCRRWNATQELSFVAWTPDGTRLRPLAETELHSLLGMAVPVSVPPETVLIPWQGVHLVPELAAEAGRASRIRALAQYGRVQVGIIGYDVVPLTMPTYTPPNMVPAFAHYLTAAARAARIAAISEAAAGEYRGWRSMLGGRGLAGPDVKPIPLPIFGGPADDDAMGEVSLGLGLERSPLLLVVGSHEPRKNHLSILHAAELLWMEGLRFQLLFAGAKSWRSDGFEARVRELQRLGRPVKAVSQIPDSTLWAAYRLARCVVFPSLNEGYGLPIAEALAAGTPVITSDFGSMREIMAPDGHPVGGLLVDPRSDDSLAAAMRQVLSDDDVYERLRREAASRPTGSWDDYSDQLWSYLAEGSLP